MKNLNERSETPGMELSRGLRKSSFVEAPGAEEEEDGGGAGGGRESDDKTLLVDGRGLSLVEEDS